MSDPELTAMQNILAALDPLSEPARGRVIDWTISRFGIRGTHDGTVRENVTTNGTNDSDNDIAPAFQADSKNELSSLGEIFSRANPETNGQKALVVGFWLQTREGMADFDSQRVNTELKHLGYGLSNITSAFDELKSSKPALAIQLRKEGTSRQARKKFKITDAGIKTVHQMLKS